MRCGLCKISPTMKSTRSADDRCFEGWKGPHTDDSVEKIKEVTKDRPTNEGRKNLGQLREEAKRKDEGAYLLWVEANKSNDHDKGDEKRVPYLFSDHNAFVGKESSRRRLMIGLMTR